MNTIDKNKVIAEFMGWKYCENDLVFHSHLDGQLPNSSVFSGWVKKEQPYTKGVPLLVVVSNKSKIEYLRKLQYHSSWDWLMPVIQKLYQQGDPIFRDSEAECKSALCYEPIEEVHKIVYQWIQKINNNK